MVKKPLKTTATRLGSGGRAKARLPEITVQLPEPGPTEKVNQHHAMEALALAAIKIAGIFQVCPYCLILNLAEATDEALEDGQIHHCDWEEVTVN